MGFLTTFLCRLYSFYVGNIVGNQTRVLRRRFSAEATLKIAALYSILRLKTKVTCWNLTEKLANALLLRPPVLDAGSVIIER